jgi:hypothetical protein
MTIIIDALTVTAWYRNISRWVRMTSIIFVCKTCDGCVSRFTIKSHYFPTYCYITLKVSHRTIYIHISWSLTLISHWVP